jgi:glycerol-3-phosphate acyltransferase PlsX
MKKRIAVDAMGGDHFPESEVAGAILAAREYGHEVILVGQEALLHEHLRKHRDAARLPVRVVHASEFITMHDSAAKAVRTKKDSSIRVACRLVRDGEADAVVSAGNTGAVMATAKMVLRPIPGVERPALASVFPTAKGPDHPAVMADVGANVDCTPTMLAQFALMGEIYARAIFGYASPRVGILSIGEEEHKGNELTKATTPLLKDLPINFIGNVEGRDLYGGEVEVVVCDGFIGNVALKVSEGLVETIRHILKDSMEATVTRKLGYVLSRPAFQDFKKRLDYSEYGGAPLLGVQGCTIVCHGRSNPNAIKNAVRVAAEFAEAKVNHQIEREMGRLRELTSTPDAEFV